VTWEVNKLRSHEDRGEFQARTMGGFGVGNGELWQLGFAIKKGSAALCSPGYGTRKRKRSKAGVNGLS